MTITHNEKQSGFLRLPEVLKLFPVSKSTWWQGIKDGTYPQPVKLSTRTTAWRVSDINELIKSIDGDSNG